MKLGQEGKHRYTSPRSEAVVRVILSRRPDLRTKNLNGQTVSDKVRQVRREEVTHSIERGLSR
jgi:hypothetical protein